MWHLRALAVAALSLPMLIGSGCGDGSKPEAAAQKKTDVAQQQLDKAAQDLKAAQDELATKRTELAAKTAEVQNLQKQLSALQAKVADISAKLDEALKFGAPNAPAPVAAPANPAATGAIRIQRASARRAPAASAPVAVPAESAVAGAIDRASALFAEGKYAEAGEIVDALVAAPPAGAQPCELRKAQLLQIAMVSKRMVEPVKIPAPNAPAPAPAAAPANPAMAEAIGRASALFAAGKCARAGEILYRLIADPPAGAQPQEIRKAQLLLARVNGVLAEQYRAIQAANQRLAAAELQRAEQREARRTRENEMLAEADRLFEQAQAGCAPEENYPEARRLYAQVAADRAGDAFNVAMDNYDAGLYNGAQKVLERLLAFMDEQRADGLRFEPGLGADRVQRIAECLKELPDARDNLAQGALLIKGAVASSR